MANKCNGCGKFISSVDGAKCKKCAQMFHRVCLNNMSPYNLTNPKWLCRGCKCTSPSPAVDLNSTAANICAEQGTANNNNNSCGMEAMVKAIDLLRSELSACTKELASFRQEITNIRTCLTEFSERMDNVEQRLSRLEERSGSDVVSDVNATIDKLKSDLNDRDQELLQNDVEITGIPESSGENLMHLVGLVANKLGVNVDERDIVSVHRAGPRRIGDGRSGEGRVRGICVRLARRSLRDDLLSAARMRRGADTSGFNTDAQPRRFYINERLTRTNRQLFYSARVKGKASGWKYVWTRDGHIFARRDSGPHNTRYCIKTAQDLDRVFSV